MKDFSAVDLTAAAVGFPARLCVITRRDGEVYRFAESDEPIVVGGDTYSLAPGLQISAIKHTSDGGVPSCTVAAVHELGGIFDTQDVDIGFFDAAAVEIHLVDRANLAAGKGMMFKGTIADISYNTEHQVIFDVKGPVVSAKVLMTQRRSPMCRTDLYSVLCGVDKTAWDVATTVDAIGTAFSFTVTGGLSQATGWFNQGVVVMPNGLGFEIANWTQSTQTINTYLPINRILSAGLALTLYPGCDKTLGPNGCQKYSNQLNFQGEPHFTGTAAAAQQV